MEISTVQAELCNVQWRKEGQLQAAGRRARSRVPPSFFPLPQTRRKVEAPRFWGSPSSSSSPKLPVLAPGTHTSDYSALAPVVQLSGRHQTAGSETSARHLVVRSKRRVDAFALPSLATLALSLSKDATDTRSIHTHSPNATLIHPAHTRSRARRRSLNSINKFSDQSSAAFPNLDPLRLVDAQHGTSGLLERDRRYRICNRDRHDFDPDHHRNADAGRRRTGRGESRPPEDEHTLGTPTHASLE